MRRQKVGTLIASVLSVVIAAGILFPICAEHAVLGLDLQGGVAVRLEAPDGTSQEDMEAAKTMECKYFSVERYDLAEENSFNLDDSSFRAFVVLEGTGTIRGGEVEIPYRPADCFFVPAGKKTVAFEGSGIVLKVQV